MNFPEGNIQIEQGQLDLAIERLRQCVERLQLLDRNFAKIGNRIFGAQPETASVTNGTSLPDGSLPILHQLLDETFNMIRNLESDLERLARL